MPRLAIWLAALPDLLVGLSFLALWIDPSSFPDGAVAYGFLAVLLECVIIHTSVAMGAVILATGPRVKRAIVALVFCVSYTLLVLALCLRFHTLWPLGAFWLLTANRLSSLLLVSTTAQDEPRMMLRAWAATWSLCLVAGFAVVSFPIPRFGLTVAFVNAQPLPEWVHEPHRLIAMGFLYFTAVSISEFFEHRWAAGFTQARQAAA